VLKSFFTSINSSQSSKRTHVNKNIIKTFTSIIYTVSLFLHKCLCVFMYPFQRKFINIYTAELQLDRLPFRVLPICIKYILIYFVDIDSWILFFKRIKNHSNLYIRREQNMPQLYRLWVFFFEKGRFTTLN